MGLYERLATAIELMEREERCWLLLKTAEAFEPEIVSTSGREVGEPASVFRMTEPKRISRMLPVGCACGPETVRVPVPVLVRVLAEGALSVPESVRAPPVILKSRLSATVIGALMVWEPVGTVMEVCRPLWEK